MTQAQTHWVKINGETYKMKDSKVTFLPAGRRIRRWHKFVTGLVRGVMTTICLGCAKMFEVVESVGLDVIRRIEQQGMLTNARILRGAC